MIFFCPTQMTNECSFGAGQRQMANFGGFTRGIFFYNCNPAKTV